MFPLASFKTHYFLRCTLWAVERKYVTIISKMAHSLSDIGHVLNFNSNLQRQLKFCVHCKCCIQWKRQCKVCNHPSDPIKCHLILLLFLKTIPNFKTIICWWDQGLSKILPFNISLYLLFKESNFFRNCKNSIHDCRQIVCAKFQTCNVTRHRFTYPCLPSPWQQTKKGSRYVFTLK